MNSTKLCFLLLQTTLFYRLLTCETVLTTSIILSVIQEFSNNVTSVFNQTSETTSSGSALTYVTTTSSTASLQYTTRINKCKYNSDCSYHSFCLTGYCLEVSTTLISIDTTANSLEINPLLWVVIAGAPSIIILVILLAIAIYCRKSCKITSLCRRRRRTERESETSERAVSGRSSEGYSENIRQEVTPPPLYNEVTTVLSPINTSSCNNVPLFVFKLPSYSSFIKKNPVHVTEVM
jgi:hypothetical protein